jgi:hypothetical protein
MTRLTDASQPLTTDEHSIVVPHAPILIAIGSIVFLFISIFISDAGRFQPASIDVNGLMVVSYARDIDVGASSKIELTVKNDAHVPVRIGLGESFSAAFEILSVKPFPTQLSKGSDGNLTLSYANPPENLSVIFEVRGLEASKIVYAVSANANEEHSSSVRIAQQIQ